MLASPSADTAAEPIQTSRLIQRTPLGVGAYPNLINWLIPLVGGSISSWGKHPELNADWPDHSG